MRRNTFAMLPTVLLVLVATLLITVPVILAPEPTLTPTPTLTATTTATDQPAATETPRISPTPTATYTPSPSLTPSATITPTATAFALNTHKELDRYIYVDQMAQRMYIFEKGTLTRTILVSTGMPEAYTLTPAWEGKIGWFVGSFFSFGTYADEAWFLFNDGFLIHALPYLPDADGNKVYQGREFLGVRPASHGCIRISPEDAAWFNAWNPAGVLITISDPYVDYWRSKPQETATPTVAPTFTPTAVPTNTPAATPSAAS